MVLPQIQPTPGLGQRNDRLLEDELHGVLRLGYGKSEARPGGTVAKLFLRRLDSRA